MDRYHRQTLLPQIGREGQAKLARSRVLLVGCGALGTVMAEQLVRAGVGTLEIVDRDVVELTNLQRQVLFDEEDAREGTPKAVAAAKRLGRINSEVRVVPRVVDFHAGNAEEIAGLPSVSLSPVLGGEGRGEGPSSESRNERQFALLGGESPKPLTLTLSPEYRGEGTKRDDTQIPDLILDGTDNAETRYLLNDLSVKYSIPWIYGACVGMEGRMMAIRPGVTACLRCIFPMPPAPGELPTCDTAGVFSPVAAMIASLQTAAALKILSGNPEAAAEQLVRVDLWNDRIATTRTSGAKRDDCPACGQRQFEFLESRSRDRSAHLCGRNAVQVHPTSTASLDLSRLAVKLAGNGKVERTPYLLRCDLNSSGELKLTVFPDGRLIVHGTTDLNHARSLYARYLGI